MAENVRIVGLSKRFVRPDDPSRPVLAVQDVSLDVEAGRLVTLLGPSGCGKSTLLRMVAGFEEPTAGEIWFGDRRMNDVAPNRRDATMVFQSYAIFPHLSVYENIAFGLRLQKLARADLARRVDRVLEMTGLGGMAQRAPSQLSGGQQQRVALARAIVMEPRVLLFDEPLSNLDAKLREQMRIEIRELQQRLGITSLYVTHDQVEAMSISDRIVVMNEGRVEQVGTPTEIYSRPANRFIADFIGKANILPAVAAGPSEIELAGVRLALADAPALAAGAPLTVVIRPEAIAIAAAGGAVRGRVARAMFLGSIAEYLVEVPGSEPWLVDSGNPGVSPLFAVGEEVFLTPAPAAIHVLV